MERIKIKRKNLKRNIQTLFHLLQLYHNGISKCICIIIASISITLVSIYFFLCGIKISLNYFGDISTLKKTYIFEFNENSEFETLTKILPRIQKYSPKTNDVLVYMVEGTKTRNIKLIFPQEMECFNVESDSFHLIEGRYFSKKEIEEGSKVIILSYLDYRNSYSENTIGDIISYGGMKFKLIGIHNTINDTRILLPYNTIAKEPDSMGEAEIKIGNIDMEFSEKLSRGIMNKMEEQFYEETGNSIVIKSHFSQVIYGFAYDTLRYIFIIILIFGLFALCIKQLYSIVDRMNQHKQDVLLRLGMDEGMWQLSRFIGMEGCILASYIISIIFFYRISYITSKVDFQASLSIWNTILILALFQGIFFLRIPIRRIRQRRGKGTE